MKKYGMLLPFLAVLVSAYVAYMGLNGMGMSEESVRQTGIHLAKISFSLFILIYITSALFAKYPSQITQALLQNRRYLGISYGVVHLAHGAVIVTYMGLFGVGAISWITLVAGSLGYVVIIAMLATSNDASVAKLGAKWHTLHRWGMHYLWFVFTYTLVTKSFENPAFISSAVVAIGAFAFRIWVIRR